MITIVWHLFDLVSCVQWATPDEVLAIYEKAWGLSRPSKIPAPYLSALFDDCLDPKQSVYWQCASASSP